MTFLEKAKALTAKWLDYLGLGDWNVAVEVGDLGPNLGECVADWKYLQALIRYRDPSLFRGGEYDLEAVVAHEVAHLPFSALETEAGTWQRNLEEHLVERFSRSMLRIVRGNPGMSQARISERLRAMVGATVRARRAMNDRRYRMDPKLLELLLKAGEFSGREDVPEDVKELLGQLAAAVATGAAPAGEGEAEPPASEDPEDKPGEPPPAVEDQPMPPQRATIDAIAALARKDAEAAASYAAKAKKAAETRYREELFAGAPDVFPAAMPRAREAYQDASPEEIERHIKAVRARTAPPQSPPPAPAPRSRQAAPEPREPLPEQPQITNPGGLMIFAGGNKRVS